MLPQLQRCLPLSHLHQIAYSVLWSARATIAASAASAASAATAATAAKGTATIVTASATGTTTATATAMHHSIIHSSRMCHLLGAGAVLSKFLYASLVLADSLPTTPCAVCHHAC